ncbi:glycosyltransferase [candidate division TA06 bacterium]|uniref:Glycosyltransferase n=1 Tax=candidate division TA06 bacterium TaxID=2250710 RepID=A0A933MJQ4_UNCT6|nr:glycosyltransferase [candidate division TA06 bacterium]
MKIILAGVFNVPWSTNQFMKKHLERLGHQVLPFEIDWSHPRPLNLAERIKFKFSTTAKGRQAGTKLLQMAQAQNPDAVIIVKGKRLNPGITKQLAAQALVAYRYMDAPLLPYVAAHASASHLTLVTGGHLVDPLAKITGNNNVYKLLEGCDPEAHKPVSFDQEYSCDVAFVGAPARDRISLLRASKKAGYKIMIWGSPGWPKDLGYCQKFAYGQDFAKVCASARIVLGINSRNDCPGYFSDRAFLVLACRGFFLTHYVPGLEKYFDNHKQLVWFKDRTELLGMTDKYIRGDAARSDIAGAGQKLVYQKYTWEKSMRVLMEILKQQKR